MIERAQLEFLRSDPDNDGPDYAASLSELRETGANFWLAHADFLDHPYRFELRGEGRLVFVCVHPNEPFHLDIMKEICERYIFVQKGKLSEAPDFDSLLQNEDVQSYLGHLAEGLN